MNDKNQVREIQRVPAWMLLIAVVLVGLLSLVWFKEAGSDIANWIWAALVLAMLGVASFSLRMAADNERAAIFFLGKFWIVKGPGSYLALPFIYSVVTVNLDKHIPDWHKLHEKDIKRRVAELAIVAYNVEK